MLIPVIAGSEGGVDSFAASTLWVGVGIRMGSELLTLEALGRILRLPMRVRPMMSVI